MGAATSFRQTKMVLTYDGGQHTVEGSECGYRFEADALVLWENVGGEKKTYVFPIARVIRLDIHQSS